MIFATSVSSPCFNFSSCRAWPSGEISASLRSMFFRLTLRRASLPRTISSSAVSLNWLIALNLIVSFSRTISALASRKSKRLASSFCACSTAFFTSIRSTSETTSKEGIGDDGGPDSRRAGLLGDGTWVGLRIEAVNDARLGEVVLRHLHFHPVAGGQADETLAHFARDMGQDNVLAVVQLDAKHRTGQDR